MQCVVYNCFNKRNTVDGKMSFFSFPKEKQLCEKWIQFCRNRRSFNPSSWRIYMDNFDPVDIVGDLQIEMGLGTKRHLRPGAVPCVYKERISLQKQIRLKRLQKQINKKLVDSLLCESNALIVANRNISTGSPKGSSTAVDASFKQDIEEASAMTAPLQTAGSYRINNGAIKNYSYKKTELQLNVFEKVNMLQKEVDGLKKANIELQQQLSTSRNKYVDEINILKKSLQKEKLEKQNMQQKLLTKKMLVIFTKLPGKRKDDNSASTETKLEEL